MWKNTDRNKMKVYFNILSFLLLIFLDNMQVTLQVQVQSFQTKINQATKISYHNKGTRRSCLQKFHIVITKSKRKLLLHWYWILKYINILYLWINNYRLLHIQQRSKIFPFRCFINVWTFYNQQEKPC